MVTYLAESIFKFQILFGQFKNVVSIGKIAHDIRQKLFYMNKENQQDLESFSDQFDSIIIFDRCVDLITLIVPQFTYSGMIDDALNIRFNSIIQENEKQEHLLYHLFDEDNFFN